MKRKHDPEKADTSTEDYSFDSTVDNDTKCAPLAQEVEEIQPQGNESTSIDVVLRRNGALQEIIDHVMQLALAAEDDPPVVLDWNIFKLLVVLSSPAAQVAVPPLPPGFVLPPAPITEDALKSSILNCIRGLPPQPALIPGNNFGFEATNAQVGNIAAAASLQCIHPWWAHQDAQSILMGNGTICPIARIWIPRPRSKTVDRTAMIPLFPGVIPLFN